jgi:antiviral helicase SKI2
MKTLNSFQCTKCPDLLAHYGIVHQEQRLQETLKELEHNLSDLNLELLPEYHQRISVLKDLQFIDEKSIVQVKGYASHI